MYIWELIGTGLAWYHSLSLATCKKTGMNTRGKKFAISTNKMATILCINGKTSRAIVLHYSTNYA